MDYTIQHINEIVKGQATSTPLPDSTVTDLSFDSRKISEGLSTIFFALKGIKSDGHDYLDAAYSQGVRNFVVSQTFSLEKFSDANFVQVDDTRIALQKLARYHRQQLHFPVIAITGSNGKTMVKEWLALALESKKTVTKTPLSYNSQIGVPYSVLSLNTAADIAILEAGISEQGEMKNLEAILRPEIGLYTNLGDAHDSGFTSREEKLEEKLLLFKNSDLIIYNADQDLVDKKIKEIYPKKARSWGVVASAHISIVDKQTIDQTTELLLQHKQKKILLSLPFTEAAFVENSMTVIAYLILDGWQQEEIQSVIHKFSTLPNRLEIRKGHKNCILLNDSYSSDLASTRLALAQLQQQGEGRKKIAFLTMLEHQKEDAAYLDLIQSALSEQKIDALIAIGFPTHWDGIHTTHYPSTSACLQHYDFDQLQDAVILIKGASKQNLGVLMSKMTLQVSDTTLETNLSAIAHNLNVYRKRLRPTTQIMAVIKAQAYGSGSQHLANFLATQKVNYLGVALVDEAIALRQNGSHLPIMIFNVQLENLSRLWQYQLEPEVFSFELLEALIAEADQNKKLRALPIHLKVDSGMHRLGFTAADLSRVQALLQSQKNLVVKSIFSHLSASEDPQYDAFTQQQLQLFDEMYATLCEGLDISPLKHILNTSGVLRFPDHQYDMVRIGLGLYGVDESQSVTTELQKAHTLKAVVLQVKHVPAGQTTGYARSGKLDTDTDIAILSIGYADGLLRAAGNGAHKVRLGTHLCPTIGNICMDVCMVILPTNHGIQPGDEAIIIGHNNPVENLATACNTITYEVLSRISPRVKRTYIQD